MPKIPKPKLNTSLLQNMTRNSNKPRCKACEGTGKSSKGRECVPCDGKGWRNP